MTGNACMTCAHFDPSVREKNVCAAFPDGIPAQIASGKHDHRTNVTGDHGITWKPAPGFEYMGEAGE